jgi:hypothetical protein
MGKFRVRGPGRAPVSSTSPTVEFFFFLLSSKLILLISGGEGERKESKEGMEGESKWTGGGEKGQSCKEDKEEESSIWLAHNFAEFKHLNIFIEIFTIFSSPTIFHPTP